MPVNRRIVGASAAEKLFILSKALEQRAKDEAATAALETIRAAYFDEYTDAVEMDDDFRTAFDGIFAVLFPSGEDTKGRDTDFYAKKS